VTQKHAAVSGVSNVRSATAVFDESAAKADRTEAVAGAQPEPEPEGLMWSGLSSGEVPKPSNALTRNGPAIGDLPAATGSGAATVAVVASAARCA
jgi:hypothetical protein